MKIRVAVVVLAGSALLLGGCSQPTPVAAPVSTSAPKTSTVASSTARTTTARTTTSSTKDVLGDLCERHCAELTEISKLPACSDGQSCVQQVGRAKDAITELRQDMIDNDIDRARFIDLDDDLTKITGSIDEYNTFACVDEVKGSQDMFICAIDALTIKTQAGLVVYALGGDPMS